ncbi:MAG: replication initiation protein [Janthinobacterium lividum]
MSSPSIPIVSPHPLVVQHNALVNARIDLNTIESRLFLSLLGRVSRQDAGFAPCQVPVREIMGATVSKTMYDQVRKTLKEFAGRTIVIEKLDESGKPLKRPDFVVLPLLAYAEYKQGEGLVEAQFNDRLIPYLLELRDNFTKAQLAELLKLKSASSYRIYWLLREYAAFGKRTIGLLELKAILGLEKEYDRFDNFKVRVLDRAQQELADTDMPFTYELIRQGKAVSEIRFLFPPNGRQQPVLPPAADSWESALLAVGVANKSLTNVKTQLAAGYYDEGYIWFVLAAVRKKVQTGKVKKEAGAVFKALSDGYLLADYKKFLAIPSAPTKSAPKPNPVRNKQKLLSELDDVRGSLRWLRERSTKEKYSTPADYQRDLDTAVAKEASLLEQLG